MRLLSHDKRQPASTRIYNYKPPIMSIVNFNQSRVFCVLAYSISIVIKSQQLLFKAQTATAKVELINQAHQWTNSQQINKSRNTRDQAQLRK